MQAVLALLYPNAAGDVPGTAGPVLEGAGGIPLVGSGLGGALPGYAVHVQLRCAAPSPPL